MDPNTFPTVLLGDVHGRYDLLQGALHTLALIDDDGRWTGGTRRLIQVGDVGDRGPQALEAFHLLMRLEQEAAAAGGEVIYLLGNHELLALCAGSGDPWYRMNWTLNGGGANYVNWLQQRGLAGDERDVPYPEEFYGLFAPSGEIGRWLMRHPIAVRAGDYVVVHAGWPLHAPATVEAANAACLATPTDPKAFVAAMRNPRHPASQESGLLWVRQQPEQAIVAACARLGCRGLITGHTPVWGIKTSVGGRLLQIDVGMTWRDTWAALGLDAAGNPWALLPGQPPQSVAEDGFVPLPGDPGEQAPPVRVPLRFGPGDLVHLYSTRDGAWRMYLHILDTGGTLTSRLYLAVALTYSQGDGWTRAVQPQWPAELVDHYGRPADQNAVPANFL